MIFALALGLLWTMVLHLFRRYSRLLSWIFTSLLSLTKLSRRSNLFILLNDTLYSAATVFFGDPLANERNILAFSLPNIFLVLKFGDWVMI